MEKSWAGKFYREFFYRLNKDAFAKMYADAPSRPNTSVNVLIGLETLKAAFGWSDEERYDHYIFDICTMYNFRRRLSHYNLEHGVNLITEAFTDIIDQQIAAFKLHTEQQRMDSTQIASNILDAS